VSHFSQESQCPFVDIRQTEFRINDLLARIQAVIAGDNIADHTGEKEVGGTLKPEHLTADDEG
jgi:hypothetical protein